MGHRVYLEKDIEYVDGVIKSGEYDCLYEEAELCYVKVGDYIVGINRSLLNTPKKSKKVEVNVGSA